MNKNLSLAIEKAFTKINPKNLYQQKRNNGTKKPDLFFIMFYKCSID